VRIPTAPGLWRCRKCLSTFAEPSFSEGPKTKHPETGVESVRFKKSRLLCPVCFGLDLQPPALAEHPAT